MRLCSVGRSFGSSWEPGSLGITAPGECGFFPNRELFFFYMPFNTFPKEEGKERKALTQSNPESHPDKNELVCFFSNDVKKRKDLGQCGSLGSPRLLNSAHLRSSPK